MNTYDRQHLLAEQNFLREQFREHACLSAPHAHEYPGTASVN